jgi:anti-sigma-K factor RskA
VVKAMRDDDLHMLSGSYVLDALSEAERDSFERHLQHCALCDDEVRGLRETAARLGLAKSLEPPPKMRARVLSAAHRTRQLPPPVGERIALDHRRTRVTRLFGGSRGTALRRGQRWPSVPRLATALAAAAVAVVAALGITQAVTGHQTGGTQTASVTISQVLTAPDAHSQTLRTSAGGSVTVVVSATRHAVVVSALGMRSLPATETYQLWVMGPDGARSAGLLSGTGRTGPVLAGGVRPGDRIGITVEPAGGTSSPTTNPVIAVPV